ncbi:MAG: hypothetical protein RLY71_2102 [Pseudomonadota bacterium]
MKLAQTIATGLTLLGLLSATGLAGAQHAHGAAAAGQPDHAAHAGQADMHAQHMMAAGDARQLVNFPAPMRTHTLSSMRDHLQALADIQGALAKGAFDQVAEVAEQRLGMTSLKAHGAHESSRYMPQGMQDIGTTMHHSASQLALEAQNAAATGDIKPVLAALARTTQACTACHAAYRLQ